MLVHSFNPFGNLALSSLIADSNHFILVMFNSV